MDSSAFGRKQPGPIVLGSTLGPGDDEASVTVTSPDTDLAHVVELWPAIPPEVRQTIVQMAETWGGSRG